MAREMGLTDAAHRVVLRRKNGSETVLGPYKTAGIAKGILTSKLNDQYSPFDMGWVETTSMTWVRDEKTIKLHKRMF